MRLTLLLVVVGILVGLGAACKTDVKYYCDKDTPCLPRYPDRPYCDLTGQYEPDGVKNTCVASPFDAGGPDGAVSIDAATDLDAGADAMMSPDAAGPPEITVDSNSQNFGSVVQGQSSAGVSFTVTNIGGMPAGAIAISKSGTDTVDFMTSGDCLDAVLQPSDSCTVTVTFSPQSPGSKSAELDISASPGGNLMVALSGDGLTPGALSISPTSYSFSNTNIASMSSTHTFTVTNTGGSSTGALAVSLSNTTDFAIGSDNCNGTTLAASGNCTVTVKFTPSTVGSAIGSLVVQGTPGGQVSASVGGTGTATVAVSKTGSGVSGGTVKSTPTGIDCGGTCSAEFTASSVTLSATTDSSTTFNGWSGEGCSGMGTCVVTTASNRNVTATFVTNPAELTVSPTSQDFGTVVQGQSSSGVSFTVTNVGAQPSGTIAVSKSGTDTADFTTTGDCQSAVLQPAGTCTVTVTFSPNSTGTKSAELDISASPGGSLMVPLSGKALSQGSLSISPTSYTFADTNIAATSSSHSFTVTNTGGSSTGTLGVSLTNTSDFTIASENCSSTTLAAAGSCQVLVKFAPSAVGANLGSLVVQASPGGQVSASLGGTGTASITLTKTGGGASGGTVTSSPSGISCGGTCSGEFSANNVTLTATTDGSTSFAGWSGAGCTGTGTCNVTMTSNQSVSAEFLTNQCTPSTTSCSGSTLTICDSLGQVSSTSTCALGCYTDGTRCYDVDPSNGLATYLDMTPSAGDITLPDGSTINTDTGEVRDDTNARVTVDTYTMAAPANGVAVRILRVPKISMGNVTVSGTEALAIVSDGDITITGKLDVGAHLTIAGPGAYLSCHGQAAAASGYEASGGGGGGFLWAGYKGGDTISLTGGAGGAGSQGTTNLVPLRGGCAGGGAQDYNNTSGYDRGGGGGGAVQLVSRSKIVLNGSGEIDVSGGGGTSVGGIIVYMEGRVGAAFGGGSGGAALLEAPIVEFASATGVHANGGSGGCAFTNGSDGTLTSTTAAPGAVCSATGRGSGGNGAVESAAATPGWNDTSGTVQSGGGGGGGLGRIRVNAVTYNPLSGSIVSPTASTGSLGKR